LQSSATIEKTMLTKNASIGILIPCYNEEKRIAAVIAKCQRITPAIYVCDDGSTDLSAEIATKMGAIVLKHPRNLGYGSALRTLFESAADSNLKVVVTLDGDGQHDPAYIPFLVQPVLDGTADIVIGSRFIEQDEKGPKETGSPFYRTYGIKLITAATNLTNSIDIKDAQSGLRAYNVRILREIFPAETDMSASTEILMKASASNLKVIEQPVKIIYHEESSKENPLKQGATVLFGVFKQYSLRHPLIFYGIPGLVSTIIAASFWILLLTDYTISHTIHTDLAIFAIGFSIVAAVLVNTAIVLWTIINYFQTR
jgi:glycosyltransferase involved in cell wall biosynthesis